VADIKNDVFYAALIPHTLKITTLGFKKVGSMVNIEVDMTAKYMESFIRNYFSRKDRK
jgi:riboflavin synthase